MQAPTIRSNGKPYSLKENKDRFFYPEEYMKFFDVLNKKQKHTIKCLINTGARINEIRNVKVEDIDFINKRVILRVTKAKARKGERKGRTRTIPISSQFTRYLKKYCNGLGKDSYINIHSTPAISVSIKKAAKKVKIGDWKNFSAHNMRKTLEVWLMSLGVDGLVLTAHIGHDMRTAAMHYVSPDIFTFEEKKQMRLIIGDLYGR